MIILSSYVIISFVQIKYDSGVLFSLLLCFGRLMAVNVVEASPEILWTDFELLCCLTTCIQADYDTLQNEILYSTGLSEIATDFRNKETNKEKYTQIAKICETRKSPENS